MSVKQNFLKFWLSIALLISIINNIYSDSSKSLIYSGKVKTLVLLDDWHYLDSHTMFWKQLESN